MSTPLNVNGAIFNYPQDFDTGWGIDATGWAQAVTSGMLQKAGGSFPLTADADFGSAFGLKAIYKTRAANPATAGTIRLASADPGVAFRNNANSGDLILTTDSFDDLVYNGNVIAVSTGGPISVIRGGTGDGSLSAYSVLCGGTTSTNPVQSVSGVGLSGQALTSNGPAALPTWQNVSGSGTVNSGTAGQMAYYASSSNVVGSAPFLSFSSPVLTYNANSGNSLLQVVSTGAAASLIRFVANSLTTQIAQGSTGGFSMTDSDNAVTFFDYERAAGGSITLSTPLAMGSHKITGVTDPAAAQDAATKNYVDTSITTYVGVIGTTVESVVGGSTAYTTSGVTINITSISIPAGKWMISGLVYALINGATWSGLYCSLTTASTGNGTPGNNSSSWDWANSSTTPIDVTLTIPSFITTLGSTTTYYLTSFSNFTAGHPAAQTCRITAVQIGH